MTPSDMILAGKTRLFFEHPFYGVLLSHLQMVETYTIKSMDTNGTILRYNPDFVAGLSIPAIVFVLAHEVSHIANLHHVRQGGRDGAKWNKACDYAINPDLIEAKVGVAPVGTLIDPQYAGMGAEEIYRLLPDDPGQGGAQPGSAPASAGGAGNPDPAGTGGIQPAAAPTDTAALGDAAAEADVRTRQAAAIAKSANAGTLPADIERLVERLTSASVDWRSELRRFADDCENRTTTWSRPNKRMLPLGFILPSQVSDGLAHLVCVADTSGSCTGAMLSAFGGEIDAAFNGTQIDRLTIIYADAKVQRVDTYDRGDAIEMTPVGGGGTNFRPSFDWIRDNAPDATAVIYLTDLIVRDFGDDPGMPVLWAVYGDSRKFDGLAGKVPFGECVRVTPD